MKDNKEISILKGLFGSFVNTHSSKNVNKDINNNTFINGSVHTLFSENENTDICIGMI